MGRKAGSRTRRSLVFISHSGPDTWIARQIAGAIETCGATTFLDEAQIAVGADFEEDILSALGQANELVVLITPWALERPYIWAELGVARFRRIPIAALLLGMTAADLQAKPQIPVFLKARNVIALNDIDRYLRELRRRLRS